MMIIDNMKNSVIIHSLLNMNSNIQLEYYNLLHALGFSIC